MRASYTIDDCKQLAAEYGGSCLSRRYAGVKGKLWWRCGAGHRWQATWGNVVYHGTWCPTCATAAVYTIDDMRAIAQQRGGTCLSTTYVNSRTKLRWQCAEGHVWQARPDVLAGGTWCPRCANRVPWTLAELDAAVRERGGRCLAQTRARGQYRWRCAFGHDWTAASGQVLKGRWCPECAGHRPLTLADLQRTARQRGGKCLADECLGSQVKIEWQCKKGHRWTATPNQIRSNRTWCPECAADRSRAGIRRLDIYDMQRIAREHGGRCVSEFYVNSETKLQWECAEGHRWRTTSRQIRAGHWCPDCAGTSRFTIEDMRALAARYRGECLSSEYVKNSVKLRWRCGRGHGFWAAPADLKRSKSFCPECRPSRPGSLPEMRAIAAERGGRCLSHEYVNAYTHLEWSCAKGHRWRAVPSSIKRGSWCAICSRTTARQSLIARLEAR